MRQSFYNFYANRFTLFSSVKLHAFKFNPKQYKRNINTFQTLQKCYEYITVLQLLFIKLNTNKKRKLLNVVSFRHNKRQLYYYNNLLSFAFYIVLYLIYRSKTRCTFPTYLQ